MRKGTSGTAFTAPGDDAGHSDLARCPRGPSGPRRLAAIGLALASLAGTGLFMSAPSAAYAGPLSTTMSVGSRLFPSGTFLPGGVSGRIAVTPGSLAVLTAPEYLYQVSAPPGTLGTVYEFMFWDVDSTLVTTEKAVFSVPTAAAPRATAWYLPVCVVSSSCTGGGATAVTTWAFSLMSYKVLPGTPISSVTPATAWTSPSTSVSTTTAVSIAASSYFGPHSTSTGGTVFSSWFVFGSPTTVTTSGLDLNVPAGESPYAIAFYYQYPGFHKPICIGYPHCI